MIHGEDVQTTVVTCKMHFKVCCNRKVKGAWDKEEGDEFKQLTSQLLDAQTPSQYLNAYESMEKFIEESGRSGLKPCLIWWDKRQHHISDAFRPTNTPNANLAKFPIHLCR